MNKIYRAFMILSFILLTAGIAKAEEAGHYDPLARNLIFVEGEAELTVPVNGFKLTFDFDVNKSSFTEAHEVTARIIERISENVKALSLPNVEIIKGWDLIKQDRISFGAKGKKISNRVVLKVTDFPEGRMQEFITKMIDAALSVDDAITLVNIEVFVTEEIENRKKEEVSTAALKALDSNAKRSAAAVGRNLSAPKRIFITNTGPAVQEQERLKYESPKLYSSALMEQRMVSIQKSFKVQTQIADHVKLSARVSGIYQID